MRAVARRRAGREICGVVLVSAILGIEDPWRSKVDGEVDGRVSPLLEQRCVEARCGSGRGSGERVWRGQEGSVAGRGCSSGEL